MESVSITSDIPSAKDFSNGLIYGNPISDEILNRGGDMEEIRSAVENAIENRLGDSMPLTAIFIDAVK